MHVWGIPGSASWAHLSPPSILQPSFLAPPSRILPVSELAGAPGSPAPLFMCRAYKRAVYNLTESPLLSASLPPRASGFLPVHPWLLPGVEGFWGAPGAMHGPHPWSTWSGASGFQRGLGAQRFWFFFLMHGRKWAIGSGRPIDQVFTQNRGFLVNLINQVPTAAPSLRLCVLGAAQRCRLRRCGMLCSSVGCVCSSQSHGPAPRCRLGQKASD